MGGKTFDKLSHLTADLRAGSDEPQTPSKTRTAPGQQIAFAVQRDQAFERAEKAEKELEILKGGSFIAVDQLHEVPGRRRKLSFEEYHDLKENLRINELVQAVTVRPRKEGGYEVISGNNRAAIYRELGKEKILAVVQTMDDEHADLAGFYANLLQPTLPDFEKYIGFKRRQELTKKNQKALAEEAGILEQSVSLIFSFDKLPQEAKELLSQKPQVLGASAATKLVAALEAGHSKRVIEAIQKLVADENFTQNQAIAYATEKEKSEEPKEQKALVINQGKKKFCQLEARRGKVAISFTDPSEADRWIKKFEAFMRSELKSQS